MDKKQRREMIVAEYLAGGVTLRELGEKHGMNFRQIHRWVKETSRDPSVARRAVKRAARQLMKGKQEEMPTDVAQLQKELSEARLYGRLLNAMIDIAEEEFCVPIRKKRGARQ